MRQQGKRNKDSLNGKNIIMITIKISKKNLLRGKGIDTLEGRIMKAAKFLAKRNGVFRYSPSLFIEVNNIHNRAELR